MVVANKREGAMAAETGYGTEGATHRGREIMGRQEQTSSALLSTYHQLSRQIIGSGSWAFTDLVENEHIRCLLISLILRGY